MERIQPYVTITACFLANHLYEIIYFLIVALSKRVAHLLVSGYEPGVIPDPGLAVTRHQIEPEEVVLPDDSLGDNDLHDHDLIDSVMYIYFGSSSHTEGGAGKQVI
jgi:hypothetical protein